jgi:hypothetical protein
MIHGGTSHRLTVGVTVQPLEEDPAITTAAP